MEISPANSEQSRVQGDFVYIGAIPTDAEALLKLNKFVFAGAELEVTASLDGFGPGLAESSPFSTPESTYTQEVRLTLRHVLSERYIGANKLLKLDSLSSDTTLSQFGMFQTKDAAQKTFQVLMVICDGLFKTAKEKRDAVESVSLAGNGIDDVSQVEALATTFPDLKHLDMSQNLMIGIASLQKWKNRFRHLETLFVAGNPLETNEPGFPTIFLEWFPALQNINGAIVRTAAEAAQSAASLSKPIPMPQHGPDFRDCNGIAEGFLLDFFTQYDNNRLELLSSLYDETSQFSLAVDTASVRNADAPAPIPWAPYLKHSRNLLKVTHPPARVQRLCRGVSMIRNLWNTLPMTRHPDLKQAIHKFIMDCHILPGLVDPLARSARGVDGMVISAHGEFEELDTATGKGGMRSFSRSFVLGPGLPGRNPVRVVSDMLSLRAYNVLPNVFSASAAEERLAIPASVSMEQRQEGDPPHWQALITDLSRQTGMTATYSRFCLTEVGWDLAKGLIIFHQKKAELPQEAFSA